MYFQKAYDILLGKSILNFEKNHFRIKITSEKFKNNFPEFNQKLNRLLEEIEELKEDKEIEHELFKDKESSKNISLEYKEDLVDLIRLLSFDHNAK